MNEPYRCARGRQCADHETVAESKFGARIETRDGLCRDCERVTSRAIADLPTVFVQLETIVGEHKQGGEHVSGTKERPVPARLDVLRLQADIDASVSVWSAAVAGRCAIPWDARALRLVRPGHRVMRGARLLAHRIDALLRLTAVEVAGWVSGRSERAGLVSAPLSGLDAALVLARLHQRGRQLVTGGTGDAHLPVPCPRCEAPALVKLNGRDQVDCQACGRSWTEADYQVMCLAIADSYRGAK